MQKVPKFHYEIRDENESNFGLVTVTRCSGGGHQYILVRQRQEVLELILNVVDTNRSWIALE